MPLMVWVNNNRRATPAVQNVLRAASGSALGLGGAVELDHLRQDDLLEQIPALLEENLVAGVAGNP